MPKRKRHYVYCKAGLHLMPPIHVAPRIKNSPGIKRQPRRVGDRGRIYVARQCEVCKQLAKAKVRRRNTIFGK